jgi:hypothetical protein
MIPGHQGSGAAGDGHRAFLAIAKSVTTLGRCICRWTGHAAFWEKMVKSGFNFLDGSRWGGACRCGPTRTISP